MFRTLYTFCMAKTADWPMSACLARRLEQDAKVKFLPGAIHGEEKGAAFLRINPACPRATLLEALGRTAGWQTL